MGVRGALAPRGRLTAAPSVLGGLCAEEHVCRSPVSMLCLLVQVARSGSGRFFPRPHSESGRGGLTCGGRAWGSPCAAVRVLHPPEVDCLRFESMQLLEQNGGYGNAVPSRGPPPSGGSSSGGYSGGEYPRLVPTICPLGLPAGHLQGTQVLLSQGFGPDSKRQATRLGSPESPSGLDCLGLPELSGTGPLGHGELGKSMSISCPLPLSSGQHWPSAAWRDNQGWPHRHRRPPLWLAGLQPRGDLGALRQSLVGVARGLGG